MHANFEYLRAYGFTNGSPSMGLPFYLYTKIYNITPLKHKISFALLKMSSPLA